MSIIIGLAGIVGGFFIVLKSEALLNSFGRIAWFDEHLGLDGGSRLGYKLIGIFIIFISTLVMTGMIGGFLEWVLSPILKYSRME